MNRFVLLFVLCLPGLALAWKPVADGQPVALGQSGITAGLPASWVFDTTSSSVVATRDGPLLESISVSLTPHNKAFKAAKKPSSPTAAPEDLAEAYVANLQTDKNALREVTVLATDPADLAGHAAFRVHLRYRLAEHNSGAQMEEVTVGTPLAAGLLLVTFRAPAIHFFESHLADFEAVLGSVVVGPPSPPRR